MISIEASVAAVLTTCCQCQWRHNDTSRYQLPSALWWLLLPGAAYYTHLFTYFLP